MKCKQPKQTFLIAFLVLTLFFSLIQIGYAVQVKQGIILKTSSNNAQFTMGTNFDFYKVEVNSTHLWIDKTYSSKHYTRYCIYVVSPNNTQFTVNTWFETKDSFAMLTINAPASTNIVMGFTSPNLLSASVSGAVSSSWNPATKTLAFTVNTGIGSTFTITVTVTETAFNTSPENYEVEITNYEDIGGDRYVFSGTKYYTFQAKYWDGNGYEDLDTLKIKFTDGLNWIICSYDVSTGLYTLEDGSEVVNFQSGTLTILDSNLLQVTFNLYFTNKILDAFDVCIHMWCNDTSGTSDGWEIKANYFNIYNLGGHSTLTSSGDAGRIDGGDVFDLYAYNQSWVKATLTFRNLQHLKLLPMVQFKLSGDISPYFELVYQVEYCINGEWLEGYKVRMRNGISGYLGTGSNRHVGIFALWYNNGVLIKTDEVYFYHTGLSDQNTTYQYWLDLWFNKQNASSIVGGRLNAYYFPMTDTSNSWLRWLTGSNWGANESKLKQSMFFEGMIDGDGNIIHTQQIEMVRVSFLLNCSGTLYSYKVTVSNHNVFDIDIGSDPFTGIQTPVFDETKIIVMPQGGFLGSVVSTLSGAFNALGNFISPALMAFINNYLMPALLGLWNGLVSVMNSLLSFSGNPHLFTDIINFLTMLATNVGNALVYIGTLLTQGFLFLGTIFTNFATVITSFVGTFISMWDMGMGVVGGAYGVGLDFWAMTSPIIVPLLTLLAIGYVIWLITLWDERGLGAVIDHVRGVLDIGAFIFGTLLHIGQVFIQFISALIEALPF